MNSMGQVAVEQVAVRQPGELVVVGEADDLLFRSAPLGDVLERAPHLDRLALRHLGRSGGAHPDAPVLEGDQLKLEVPGLAMSERPPHRLADEGGTVGSEELERAFPRWPVVFRGHLVNAVGLHGPVQLVRGHVQLPRADLRRALRLLEEHGLAPQCAGAGTQGVLRCIALGFARALLAYRPEPGKHDSHQRDTEQQGRNLHVAQPRGPHLRGGHAHVHRDRELVQALECDVGFVPAEERPRAFHGAGCGEVLALELVEQRPLVAFEESLAHIRRGREAALQIAVVAQQPDRPAVGQRQALPDCLVPRQWHHQRQDQRWTALAVQDAHAHGENPVVHPRSEAGAPDDRSVAAEDLAEILAEHRVAVVCRRRRLVFAGGSDESAVHAESVHTGEVRFRPLVAEQPRAQRCRVSCASAHRRVLGENGSALGIALQKHLRRDRAQLRQVAQIGELFPLHCVPAEIDVRGCHSDKQQHQQREQNRQPLRQCLGSNALAVRGHRADAGEEVGQRRGGGFPGVSLLQSSSVSATRRYRLRCAQP
jgi:hypothetical protein